MRVGDKSTKTEEQGHRDGDTQRQRTRENRGMQRNGPADTRHRPDKASVNGLCKFTVSTLGLGLEAAEEGLRSR